MGSLTLGRRNCIYFAKKKEGGEGGGGDVGGGEAEDVVLDLYSRRLKNPNTYRFG